MKRRIGITALALMAIGSTVIASAQQYGYTNYGGFAYQSPLEIQYNMLLNQGASPQEAWQVLRIASRYGLNPMDVFASERMTGGFRMMVVGMAGNASSGFSGNAGFNTPFTNTAPAFTNGMAPFGQNSGMAPVFTGMAPGFTQGPAAFGQGAGMAPVFTGTAPAFTMGPAAVSTPRFVLPPTPTFGGPVGFAPSPIIGPGPLRSPFGPLLVRPGAFLVGRGRR